jgi:hypothetical protein
MDSDFIALATENPDLWKSLQKEISPSRNRSREETG